jgi:hypothetical protein
MIFVLNKIALSTAEIKHLSSETTLKITYYLIILLCLISIKYFLHMYLIKKDKYKQFYLFIQFEI